MVQENISDSSKTVIDEDGNELEVAFKGGNGKWYAGSWPRAMIENPNPEGPLWIGYGEQSNMPSRAAELSITPEGLSKQVLLTGISSLGRHNLTVSLGLQQIPKEYTSWFIGTDIGDVLERTSEDQSDRITQSKTLDIDNIQEKSESNESEQTVFTGTAEYIEALHAVNEFIESRNENENNNQVVITLQDFPAEALADADLNYTTLLSQAQRTNTAIILSLSGVHRLPRTKLDELSIATNIISFKTIESHSLLTKYMDGRDPANLGESEAFSRIYIHGETYNGIRFTAFPEYPPRKDAIRLAYQFS